MNQSQNSNSNQNTFPNGMTHNEGDFTNNNGKYTILKIKYNCMYERLTINRKEKKLETKTTLS